MEEIEVNGKKYVSKEDVTKANYCKYVTPECYMDDVKVKGIGTMELAEGYVLAKFSIKHLVELLEATKQFEGDDTYPSCHVALKNDSPIAIGRATEDKKFISGFILAPVRDT